MNKSVIHHKADSLFLVNDVNSDDSDAPVSSLDIRGNVYWVKLLYNNTSSL
ncbi:MAG: hypothetical protein JSS63_04065 [Bacteroidetes bacterium]|nr:hypothetical protein [Bacteroidota bacterium]MBX7045736.1 hypothetical protein [Ignavibacteria bacterium]